MDHVAVVVEEAIVENLKAPLPHEELEQSYLSPVGIDTTYLNVAPGSLATLHPSDKLLDMRSLSIGYIHM